MSEFSYYILGIAIIIAWSFFVYGVSKIRYVYQKTDGVIRTRKDLVAIKKVISLNMKLAIFYLTLSALFILFFFVLFISGMPYRAIIILFIYGVATFPIGPIGKYFENKIKSMEIKSEDTTIAGTFQRYLTQWKKLRLTLPD